VTDNANFIYDVRFASGIDDAVELEGKLARRPGVVETGLFIGMATDVFVARDGGVQHLRRGSR
jgi:ribose 5-phosphate isomerase A